MRRRCTSVWLVAVWLVACGGAGVAYRGGYSPLRAFLTPDVGSMQGVARHAYFLCREHPQSSLPSMAALEALLESQSDLEQLEIGSAPDLAVTYIPVRSEPSSRGNTPVALYATVIANDYDLGRSLSLLRTLPSSQTDGPGPFIVVSWQKPLGAAEVGPAIINLSRVPAARMQTWMQFYKSVISKREVWSQPPRQLLMTLRDQVHQLAAGFQLALDATGLNAKVLFQ